MSLLIVCVFALFMSANAVDYRRTVVAISKATAFGENIFLRGGSAYGSVPIRHELKSLDEGFYAQTRVGDSFLDWAGAEEGQGAYATDSENHQADGTPMIHSTNDHTRDYVMNGSSLLNSIGDNLWIADFYMDCDATDDLHFQFKGYMVDLYGAGSGWEQDIYTSSCSVDGVEVGMEGQQGNHQGVCGSFNLALWDTDYCWSSTIVTDIMLFRYAWHETPISH